MLDNLCTCWLISVFLSYSHHGQSHDIFFFPVHSPPFLTSILLKADSNLACHVLLACGSWFKDFTGTLSALLDNQMHIFLALHTCWTRFLNVWARRGYKKSTVTWRRPNPGKVFGMFLRRRQQTRLLTFFIQFNVTENISYSKYCPDATFYASSYVPLWKRSIVNSRKFQQEVKLGRHMCLCVWVCACAHKCMHVCVCVCVTNNRLKGNCRGLQWLWAGPRHHPSIWRWGWIQFDIPVCLCLHHYGLKLAGSDRLRRQVAWCRRGSLRLYFRVKCWLYTMHYM